MLVNSIGQNTSFGAKLYIKGKEFKNPPSFIRDYEKLKGITTKKEGIFTIDAWRGVGNSYPKFVNCLSYNDMICREYYDKNYLQIMKDVKNRIKQGISLFI